MEGSNSNLILSHAESKTHQLARGAHCKPANQSWVNGHLLDLALCKRASSKGKLPMILARPLFQVEAIF